MEVLLSSNNTKSVTDKELQLISTNLKFVRKLEWTFPNATLREFPISRIPKCRTILKPVEALKKARETATKQPSKKASEVPEPDVPFSEAREPRLRLNIRTYRPLNRMRGRKENRSLLHPRIRPIPAHLFHQRNTLKRRSSRWKGQTQLQQRL